MNQVLCHLLYLVQLQMVSELPGHIDIFNIRLHGWMEKIAYIHEKYIYSILARKERKERKKERKKLPSTTHPSIQIHI